MPKRRTAADEHEQAESAWGPKVGFAEAFPRIESLSVDVEERPNATFAAAHPGKVRAWDRDRGEFIDCTTGNCDSGGFALGGVLRGMYLANESTKTGVLPCVGYKIRPTSKHNGQTCTSNIRYTITIRYKPETP